MPKKPLGIFSMLRPRKSRSCDRMISAAMPLVKPITTATGMKRISVPSRNSPIRNSMMPDIMVAISRLGMP